MSVDKTRHESQAPIADEDGMVVSAEMYSTLSSPDSSSPEIPAGIYLKQGGTIVHEPTNDLLLGGGEQVIVGTSRWAEFRDFYNNHCDISLEVPGAMADALQTSWSLISNTTQPLVIISYFMPRNHGADTPHSHNTLSL